MSGAVARGSRWLRVVLVVALLAALTLYALYDPGTSVWAPKCPFKLITGLDCPGCGSQRALHALLHADIASAWGANPLFVAALPYLGLGLWLQERRLRSPRAARLWDRLYGTVAAIISLVVIFAFWILRNLL